MIKKPAGTSLVVQGLRLHAYNAGGLGSIPGQETRSHMPQLKILHAVVKTQHSQNKQTTTTKPPHKKKLKNHKICILLNLTGNIHQDHILEYTLTNLRE